MIYKQMGMAVFHEMLFAKTVTGQDLSHEF